MLGGLASGRNAVSRCRRLLFLFQSLLLFLHRTLHSFSSTYPLSRALLPCLPNHRVKSLQHLQPSTSSKPDRATLIDLLILVIAICLKCNFLSNFQPSSQNCNFFYCRILSVILKQIIGIVLFAIIIANYRCNYTNYMYFFFET